MSRRDTATHYLLEHLGAVVLTGFLLLLDFLVIDWALARLAAGEPEVLRVGGAALVVGARAGVFAGVLSAALVLLGTFALVRRFGRIRSDADVDRVAAAPGGWPASELFVLVGGLTLPLNLILRGSPVLPLGLDPLGWATSPALLLATVAAFVLLVELRREQKGRRDRHALVARNVP